MATAGKNGKLVLLVGTTKGAFILRADKTRKDWTLSEPMLAGESVYAMAYDSRAGRKRIWAGPKSYFFALDVCYSDDFGKTWNRGEVPKVQYPKDSGLAVDQIWQIKPAGADQPDLMWCGVAPAGLFKSQDAGETWQLVRGLHDHPHRPQWQPGNGGLCLHTILTHPKDKKRLLVAISTGGVYRSEDGGKSFTVHNKGIRVDFGPDKFPEFGQCVHKVARDSVRPERLYLQNHGGLYRSDDDGKTWNDISKGVPSDFGFAIVAHPHQGDTAYVIPLAPEMRAVPKGKAAVYRTQDAGKTWKPMSKGMPAGEHFETVLRDGMDTDKRKPAGIYFGTRSGKIYGSANDGESWRVLKDGLPPVVCVKAVEV